MERQVKSRVKSTFILFDIKGIVRKEFVLAGQSILLTTVKFCSYCMKMCKDFALNFGDKRTGCGITTRHLTLPFSPENF
jgi:hypothetical protein